MHEIHHITFVTECSLRRCRNSRLIDRFKTKKICDFSRLSGLLKSVLLKSAADFPTVARVQSGPAALGPSIRSASTSLVRSLGGPKSNTDGQADHPTPLSTSGCQATGSSIFRQRTHLWNHIWQSRSNSLNMVAKAFCPLTPVAGCNPQQRRSRTVHRSCRSC